MCHPLIFSAQRELYPSLSDAQRLIHTPLRNAETYVERPQNATSTARNHEHECNRRTYLTRRSTLRLKDHESHGPLAVLLALSARSKSRRAEQVIQTKCSLVFCRNSAVGCSSTSGLRHALANRRGTSGANHLSPRIVS